MGLEKALLLLGEDERMEVQFNPVSYSISTPKTIERLYENVLEDGTIVSTASNEARIMKVNLTFFSYSIPTGSESLVNTSEVLLKAGISSALGKNNSTVQENIELLNDMITASQEDEYNGLTFVWEKFVFHGLVGNMETEYTMFAPSGAPIRANVSLEMTETPNWDGIGISDDTTNSIISALKGILPF